MSRHKWIWDERRRELVEADEYYSAAYQTRYHARSELSAPSFIRDNMDAVQSMLDGKMYDSKSALRATYKQAGVVEVGNDSSVFNPAPPPKPKISKAKVRATVDKAFSRAGLGA